MIISKARLAGSIVLAGALLVTAGCGYKTSPVPPQTVVPKAINDLTYSLEDNGAVLRWTYPDEAVNGKNLDQIMAFDLYRAEIPVDDFCSSCPIPFGKPQQLPGGAVGSEVLTKGECVSGMLRSGHKYYFKLRSRTSLLAASDDSNIVSFVFHTPAAAPQELTAKAGDKKVSLSWQPVTTLVDGSKAELPLNYQVMKSANGRDFSPLGGVQQKTSYVDKDVTSGRSYFYKVKSGMTFGDEAIDGSFSETVKASVVDHVPPPRVTGVTVVASTLNVRIFWDAVRVPDLAGYRIYRRMDGQKSWVKVAEVRPTQTIYVDNEIKNDSGVYYSVSAYDKDGNEGARSQEATTRY